MSDQISRLRNGYRPNDDELSTWNVAENIQVLRDQITDADLEWIIPPIREGEGLGTAFYSALLQPLSTNPQVSSFLAARFETAGPYLKAQLLWRLLDDAALSSLTHTRLFEFVMSDWNFFQKSCVAFLGSPSEMLQATLRRMADCPASKRWIYLCCLPQYADDQHAVRGLLTLASDSGAAFTADVARTLIGRFFV
jgi:hypothetical protein